MQLENRQVCLSLVQKALDNSYQVELPKDIDWSDVLDIASGQQET